MRAPSIPSPFSASARADRSAAALGEPFAVEVALGHAPDVAWRLDPAHAPAPFALRAATCEVARDGPAAATTCRLTLAREALGDGAARLRFRAGDGVFEVALPPVRAALVTSPAVPARELPLAGLAPPPELLVPTWRPVALGGAGLALGLAAAAAIALARRRARGRRRPASAGDPADLLLTAVDALGRAPLDGRELYFRLAEAVHAYAAAASGLPARGLTTRELAARLARAPVPGLDGEALAAFAARAELVRYARADATDAERRGALAFARGVAVAARARREARP